MIYDAWSRELTFANAGHAAPLMASGGAVKPLEVRHKGVLLGVRGRGIRGLPTYKEQTVKLPSRAAPVPYTDGLTDRRSRVDGPGYYTEAEAVAMRAGTRSSPRRAAGRQKAARVRSRWPPRTPCPATSTTTWRSWWSVPRLRSSLRPERTFPAEPIMVSEARRVAASTFAAWHMDPDQADLACLLVSEVVTNAVLHAAVTPSPAGRRFDLDLDPPSALPAAVPGVPGAASVPGGPRCPPPRACRPSGRAA